MKHNTCISTHSMLQWDEPLISPTGSCFSILDCGPSIKTKDKWHGLKIIIETRMFNDYTFVFLKHYYQLKHGIKL